MISQKFAESMLPPQWTEGKLSRQEDAQRVYAGCVGVGKNYLYVEWQWKVEWCINNKCVQERRRCSVKD